mmetsp:Transcript_27280/g.37946  ORF Transcript_27280/g.37946 Transcript_27280/m.37946 type:complete len:114 (+) Transcript_27280:143-484(+)
MKALCKLSVCWITAPNSVTAEKIAKMLVERNLAACVNIIPQVTSVYRWEDKVQSDCEVLMMVKTRTTLVNQLCSSVRDIHPYDVPEVISVSVDQGLPEYLKWAEECTSDSEKK